jgi:DNA-3-methyladenine glycosylase I
MKDDLYRTYHDTVWGVPERDDRALFAKLILDGAQAGLSWYTVLIRTESYAEAFDHWDAEKIARYGAEDRARLLANPGIIRNRAKVDSAIQNAQAYLQIMDRGGPGAFSDFLWRHVGHAPVVNQWQSMAQVPTSTSVSDALSRDLKAAGFSFVGSTIVYAFMQAVGMVDDHLVTCWKRNEPLTYTTHA